MTEASASLSPVSSRARMRISVSVIGRVISGPSRAEARVFSASSHGSRRPEATGCTPLGEIGRRERDREKSAAGEKSPPCKLARNTSFRVACARDNPSRGWGATLSREIAISGRRATLANLH